MLQCFQSMSIYFCNGSSLKEKGGERKKTAVSVAAELAVTFSSCSINLNERGIPLCHCCP